MNVLTGSKHCWNQHGATIKLFSCQFEENWVGKSKFRLIWNLKTVFWRINCWWQVFRQQYAEFITIISNAIISEAKYFFLILYWISQMCMKFRAFSKKRWVSWRNYLRNYWCWKTWLLKRLKGLASEHHSVMNVLTGSKHCSNKHGTTITLFSRQFEVNWVGKSHLQSDMKS